MKHPVKFGCETQIVRLIELSPKELARSIIRLVNGKRSPQKHYILHRLQLRHVTRQHQRKQVDYQMRMPPYDHVGVLAQLPKIIKFGRVARRHIRVLDNDAHKVLGEHERHSFSFDAILFLEVAQKVAEIDVKQTALLIYHYVVGMAIANAQNERGNAVGSARTSE